MANESWPKSVTFTKDGTEIAIESESALNGWIGMERGAWAQLTPNAARNAPFAQNLSLLDSLLDKNSDQDLKHVSSVYWPAQGNFGRFAAGVSNPNIRNLMMAEIMAAGTIQPQHNQPDSIIARGLAMSYSSLGARFIIAEQVNGLVQQIRDAVLEVGRLRESDAACVGQFRDLINTSEADWKNRIEGFEAKVALKAPKTFWNERASQHEMLASRNRRQWFRAMVVFVLLVVAAFGLNFLYPPPQTIPAIVVADLQRFVIFATLLAIGIWWLRQKLRDLRMHEHFAEDAAERATMVETYAALRATGLQDANLEPVLAALYRPAMGVFREDTGPSLPIDNVLRTVAEIASRPRASG